MVNLPVPNVRERIALTVVALFLVLVMVLQPKTVFDGATLGLQTWWHIVFPSLLPFFIVSELLMNLGVVHFIGVLLEPVMRPLFRLPGTASFPVAVGYSSGYPIGAAITSRLRSENLISRAEGEHLVAFTNNASPLFVLVALAVGMFHNPAVGPFLLLIHYATNFILGLAMRFYASFERTQSSYRPGLWYRAVFSFISTNGRPAGAILSDAVKASVNKLLTIGGYIILFAVIIRLLGHYGVLTVIARSLGAILLPLGFSPEILEPIAYGIFEMTLGTRMIAECNASLLEKLMAVQMVLAWSGLSIQAQVLGFISTTDIRLWLYLATRCVHAVLAALLTLVLFPVCGPTALPASQVTAGPAMEWLGLLQTSFMLSLTLPLLLVSMGLALKSMQRLFHVS